MAGEKWLQSPSGFLELIDTETNAVIAREKRRHPPRKLHGPRRPGRPRTAELEQAEENRSAHKTRLYEYSADLGNAIADAIVAGELFLSLDPKHQFPPTRVLRDWRTSIPEFAALIDRADALRKDALTELFINALDKHLAINPTAFPAKRRGRPLGSKNKKAVMMKTIDPTPEINWSDIPQVINRFGSWDAALAHKKKLKEA